MMVHRQRLLHPMARAGLLWLLWLLLARRRRTQQQQQEQQQQELWSTLVDWARSYAYGGSLSANLHSPAAQSVQPFNTFNLTAAAMMIAMMIMVITVALPLAVVCRMVMT
jgi:hypothetical protein